MRKEEKGALVVEATIVFPIMFFVLLFLIYMGNMFYMRSQVDSIASLGAIEAAARFADPMLSEVEKTGSVPRTIQDVKPYHSLFGDTSEVNSIEDDMRTKLNQLGTGFFAGMGIKNHSVSLTYKNHLFYSIVTADVQYKIQFPIRFLGASRPTVLSLQSHCVVPVTDTPEFIQNVDMAVDYADSTGLTEKLQKLKANVEKFLGR